MVNRRTKTVVFAVSFILYLLYGLFFYRLLDGFFEMAFFSFAIVSLFWLGEDIGKYEGENNKRKFIQGMLVCILAIAIYGLLANHPRETWADLLIPVLIKGIILAIAIKVLTPDDNVKNDLSKYYK